MLVAQGGKMKRKTFYNKTIKKISSVILCLLLSIGAIANGYIDVAYASDNSFSSSTTKRNEENEDEDNIDKNKLTGALEDILKGLSTYTYKAYEWEDSLSLNSVTYNIIELIYGQKSGKKMFFWSDENTTDEMKEFYSATDWTQFSGMYETVELDNYCMAVLTEEVKQYESALDKAAKDNGFSTYKEIFKAIAQAEFNEHQDDYQYAQGKGYITGDASTDKYDLFHIDGSWIDGGDTPVGAAKQSTPTPRPTATPTPIPDQLTIATPTPVYDLEEDEFQDAVIEGDETRKDGNYTVQESIDIAAKAFKEILKETVSPNPYNTETLISTVQAFEFGGKSTAITNQYTSASSSLRSSVSSEFVSFARYYDTQEESTNEDDFDTDETIEKYAKIIAHGKERNKDNEYGKYKYSDQKFYEKVFKNYKCSKNNASLDLGNLPEEYKEIMRQCMQGWGSEVTEERQNVIQQAILLYGVIYSMDYRNQPSIDNPKYLDCSSYVGQCFWRAELYDKGAAGWTTPASFTSANGFKTISESQLTPGDIGQKDLVNGGANGHVGIYVGEVNGTKYWIHCNGTTDGVAVNNTTCFKYFSTCTKYS